MNQSEEYSAKQWEHDLKRLIRRQAISKSLYEGNSFDTTKNSVRNFERTNNVQELVESLMNSEFTVGKERIKIANELYQHLVQEKKIPEEGSAVILMGSSVHGGSKLRKVTTTASGAQTTDSNDKEKSDIDYGIIGNNLSTIKFVSLSDYSEKFINGNSNFRACGYINPMIYHIENIKSEKEAITYLTKIQSIQFTHEFYLLLQPSFPPEVNQKNREFLLKGLSTIYLKDKKKWKEIINKIMSDWNKIHKIHEDHISIQGKFSNQRDEDLKTKILDRSNEIMSQSMRIFLESSKTSQEHKQITHSTLTKNLRASLKGAI